MKNKTKVLWKQCSNAEKKTKIYLFFPLLIPFHLLPLLSSPSPPCPARCSPSHLHLVLPSQRNLSAGPEAAGHLLAAAAVPEGDQRRQRPHRREQPALLLQHRQLDPTLPHFQPKGPDPQQPGPQAVLWVLPSKRRYSVPWQVLFKSPMCGLTAMQSALSLTWTISVLPWEKRKAKQHLDVMQLEEGKGLAPMKLAESVKWAVGRNCASKNGSAFIISPPQVLRHHLFMY